MLRTIIKTGTSRVLHYTGMERLVGKGGRCPVVFGYHRVVQEFSSAVKSGVIPPMLISSQMFERHLDWIGQRFSFISLEELGSNIEQGKPFQRPVAAITFDDGYSDIYHNAFPILKRKGIPAAVFVVTGLVDTSHPLAHDKLYALLLQASLQWQDSSRRLDALVRDLGIVSSSLPTVYGDGIRPFATTRELLVKLSRSEICKVVTALESSVCAPRDVTDSCKTLTWQMLAEMKNSGMTIGSHTRSHILLTNEQQSTVQQELEQSWAELTARLGPPIHHFSYPDGRFSSDSIRAVASAGYRYAYTTCHHCDLQNPLYTIPRRILWENSCVDSRGVFSSAVMSCHLSGLFDFLSGCDQDHSLPLKDALAMSTRQQMGLFAWNRLRS